MWPSLIPESLLAWWERRQVTRELRSFVEKDGWALRLDDTNPVNLAKISLSLGDRAEALRRWRSAMVRCPDFAKKSHDSLDILLGLELYDEAESIMREGMLRSPQDNFFTSGYAMAAEGRGDYPEAQKRWEVVKKKFPGWWQGHVHIALCLRQLGKSEESEAHLGRCVQLFPDAVQAWMEWARAADARCDWPEAMQRWAEMSARFNVHVAGEVGVAHALRKLGRLDEAEERLNVARWRYPLVVEIQAGLAQIAYLRGDLEESARRWADTKRRLPLLRFGYEGEISVLRELKRYSAAEDVALEAIDRFPMEPWPMIEYATLATDRSDWTEAVERWASVRSKWPSSWQGYIRAAEALSRLGREIEASALRAEHAKLASSIS